MLIELKENKANQNVNMGHIASNMLAVLLFVHDQFSSWFTWFVRDAALEPRSYDFPDTSEVFLIEVGLWLIAIKHDHDDVIKWKHIPRYWPFVRGIHRSPVNSSHKVQWRRALVFSLIYAWIKSRVNNRDAGDLRRHCAHHDVIVMQSIYRVHSSCDVRI